MSDPTGTNNRVVEVINFLAAHPTEAFTLAEITRHLSISHGSAHRLLQTLTAARYVSRHPQHKTYSLGLALVAIGQAALAKHRALDVGRRDMANLSGELQAQCVMTAVVDDELLFLAREGVSSSLEGIISVGERHLFIPPLALGHVAWAPASDVERYFSKLSLPDTMRDYLLRALQLIRQRGYSLVAKGPTMTRMRQTMNSYAGRQKDAHYWSTLESLLPQLSDAELQLESVTRDNAISHMSAPVFSPTGEVAMELCITGLSDGLSTTDIQYYIERLCATAAQITRASHGRPPVRF